MKKRKLAKRTTAVASKARAVARRINSARNLMSFSSQLEVEYRRGNLNRSVLAELKAEVSSAEIPLNSKRARLSRIKLYRTIVRG